MIKYVMELVFRKPPEQFWQNWEPIGQHSDQEQHVTSGTVTLGDEGEVKLLDRVRNQINVPQGLAAQSKAKAIGQNKISSANQRPGFQMIFFSFWYGLIYWYDLCFYGSKMMIVVEDSVHEQRMNQSIAGFLDLENSRENLVNLVSKSHLETWDLKKNISVSSRTLRYW